MKRWKEAADLVSTSTLDRRKGDRKITRLNVEIIWQLKSLQSTNSLNSLIARNIVETYKEQKKKVLSNVIVLLSIHIRNPVASFTFFFSLNFLICTVVSC